MRIVCISDTHGKHFGLNLPSGDIIVHAGDFSGHGHMIDSIKFLNWFNTLPFKNKILISGNHDIWMEQANPSELKAVIPSGITYLNDSGVNIDGINFWGSPVQPRFFNWAFNRDRGSQIKYHWDLIPNDVDILITHGPAYKILDQAPRGYGQTESVGCTDLLDAIKRTRPKLHICGHIHNSYGFKNVDETLFVNASLVDEEYKLVNNPIVVDISKNTAKIINY